MTDAERAAPLRPERKAPAKIEIAQTEAVYRGFFRLDKAVLRHERFDGALSPPLTREIFRIGPAVVALPYDPARDRVILIEQFRAGAIDHPEGAWLIETVAGLKEPGESDEETARRETFEEAGLEAKRVLPIGAYAASPGAVDERAAMFVVEVDAARAGGVHGLDHEGEDIRVLDFSAEEAFAYLDRGRIAAASAQLALSWLWRRREELRRLWGAI